MHLLDTGREKVLMDCGIFQGPREESEDKNRRFLFNPKEISTTLLSHAHLDHSGNLPSLVKQGFEGPIMATRATCDLCQVMLRDSAHIQEADIVFVNKRRRRQGLPPKEPLYTLEDAEQTISRFVPVDYDQPVEVAGLRATYRDAGHILGSAMILLEDESGRTLAFSGDLGRKGLPILRDPYPLEGADTLLLESTYGNKVHEPIEETVAKFEAVLRAAIEKRGKIVIPAFAVGRSQEIVYELHHLIRDGRIPSIPTYVDSPLSLNATEIFKRHPECYDEETKHLLNQHEDPFGFARLKYIRSVEESKALNEQEGPMIIISASGMCEGGRILHHLANTIGDPRNTILIVGFQAEGTLGKKLVDQETRVKIYGEEYQRRAPVVVLNGFSAHADRNDLLGFVSGMKRKPGRIFVVHGNEEQSQALEEGLVELGVKDVRRPRRGEEASW
jgi:metallo-beta-lactamase family protein